MLGTRPGATQDVSPARAGVYIRPVGLRIDLGLR
jgi:hypothetical protein